MPQVLTNQLFVVIVGCMCSTLLRLTRSVAPTVSLATTRYAMSCMPLPSCPTSDPSAELEPLGLVTSHPSLRPADILTSAALPGRLAALDVGVSSPDAAGAGDDCTHAMVVEKRRTYAPHLEALRRAGIQYQPMVWSSYGRAHVDAEVSPETRAALCGPADVSALFDVTVSAVIDALVPA